MIQMRVMGEPPHRIQIAHAEPLDCVTSCYTVGCGCTSFALQLSHQVAQSVEQTDAFCYTGRPITRYLLDIPSHPKQAPEGTGHRPKTRFCPRKAACCLPTRCCGLARGVSTRHQPAKDRRNEECGILVVTVGMIQGNGWTSPSESAEVARPRRIDRIAVPYCRAVPSSDSSGATFRHLADAGAALSMAVSQITLAQPVTGSRVRRVICRKAVVSPVGRDTPDRVAFRRIHHRITTRPPNGCAEHPRIAGCRRACALMTAHYHLPLAPPPPDDPPPNPPPKPPAEAPPPKPPPQPPPPRSSLSRFISPNAFVT